MLAAVLARAMVGVGLCGMVGVFVDRVCLD